MQKLAEKQQGLLYQVQWTWPCSKLFRQRDACQGSAQSVRYGECKSEGP